MVKLDKIDIQIITFLQKNSDVTKTKLAKNIGLSISPCWERVRRLEKNGIIKGYNAQINLDELAKINTFFVHIILESHKKSDWQKFEQAIMDIPQIIECYAMGGSIDYMLKLSVKDVESYQEICESLLERDIGIERYNAHVTTRCIKKEVGPDISSILQ